MVYLITGGSGFIGAHVIKRLIRDGGQIVIYDISQKGSLDQILEEQEIKKIQVIQGDITDWAYLARTVKEFGVEVIIHLASLLAHTSMLNPLLALRVNCEGTINVFEVSRLFGIKKVVWPSSSMVFGPQQLYPEEKIPNDAPHYPMSIYSACKSFNEKLAERYFHQYGVDSTALRLTYVYGPGQQGGLGATVTRELIENPALGKEGKVPLGDGIRNWLYVEDAADALILSTKAPKSMTRAFNISGDIRSTKEAIDYVRQLFPKAEVCWEPGEVPFPYRFDTALIENELGFRPKWSIEEGIRRTASVVRRQHNLSEI